MYVCVCHKLNQEMVECMIRQGKKPGHVFEEYGVKVKCGLCIPYMKDIYREINVLKRSEER